MAAGADFETGNRKLHKNPAVRTCPLQGFGRDPPFPPSCSLWSVLKSARLESHVFMFLNISSAAMSLLLCLVPLLSLRENIEEVSSPGGKVLWKYKFSLSLSGNRSHGFFQIFAFFFNKGSSQVFLCPSRLSLISSSKPYFCVFRFPVVL